MKDILKDPMKAQRLYQALNADTALFAKTIMGHIVKEVPVYQKEAYAALDRGYQNYAFVWARDLAKSTISHPIQTTKDICHAREPYVALVSETVDQASADLISIQDEIINNELIHLLYGDLKGDVWNVQSSEMRNGVYVRCFGYNSRIRGQKWKNRRPTKIILDDFESESNSATPAQRADVLNWLYARVFPATDSQQACYQLWGTVVHPDAFLGKAKDNPRFKPPLGFYQEVPIEIDGVPVWPQRRGKEWIKQTRALYEYDRRLSLFMQEYYNIPSLTGNPRFNTAMISELTGYFQREGIVTWLAHSNGDKTPLYTFIGVDPASSLAEDADNTVMCVIGALPYSGNESKRYVVLDIIAEKLSPTQQRDRLFQLVRQYSPKTVTIETQGYQGALEDMCREKMRTEGIHFAIKPFKSNKSKSNKWLLGLEPFVNAGDIYRISGLRNWNLLNEELTSYNEDLRAHDDTIDGLFLALNDAYNPPNFNVDEYLGKLRQRKDAKPRRYTWNNI